MRRFQWMLAGIAAMFASGCGVGSDEDGWKAAVANQTSRLGYRNWIVIAEASFPAHSRPGVRQVTANVEVPEAVDYVLNALEMTQHVRPNVYQTRELQSMENDFAPGIDEFRERIRESLHGYEPTVLDQQSMLVLLEDANRSYNVLVIRTASALPYSSVFLELQPGYWDSDSENRLRERIERERMEKLARPIP